MLFAGREFCRRNASLGAQPRRDLVLTESLTGGCVWLALLSFRTRSNAAEDPDGDRYFRPFQLACENKNYKIKALALDVIEKMIGTWCEGAGRATRRHQRVAGICADS